VRSILGRILIYRVDSTVDMATPFSGTSWMYSSFPLTRALPDGWQPSWKKELGVEWAHAPLATPPGTEGGFWLRIRWRTIVILFSILPIVRVIHPYRAQRLARQRGFAVQEAS
jgi:hypothetical protein